MAFAQEVEPVEPTPDDASRSLIPLIGARYAVNDAWDLSAHGSLVAGDIDGSLATARLRYMPGETWGLGLGYFGFRQSGTADRPAPRDQRIRLEAYLNLPFGEGWRISHRSRMEYRFRDVGNGWRYRPNVRVQRRFQLFDDRSLSAFAYAEPFYDFNESALTSVEYAAGVNVNLTDALNLEAWAAHSEARGQSSDFQYIGVVFTYSLN